MALDMAGMMPVFGWVFDGYNAMLYLMDEDYVNAALSAGSIFVPGSLGLIGRNAGNAASAGRVVARNANNLPSASAARQTNNMAGATRATLPGGLTRAVPGPRTLATNPNQAVFWSGMGEDGARIAENIARQQGGVTLEMAARSSGVSMPQWNASTAPIWRDASETFARQASGDVRVVLGPNVTPHSTWSTVELPALRANPNVTSVVSVDPVTLAETVIFVR